MSGPVSAYESAYPGSMFEREHGGYIRRDDPASLAGALLETIADLRRRLEDAEQALSQRDDIIAERDRLIELASVCYAGLVAECDLPEKWADVFLAASQGDAFSIDGLLPFSAGREE